MNSRARYAFICYAREDAAQVDMMQRDLQTAGVQVWRDTAQLWPGEDWRAKITKAIEHESFVFIACFSRASLSQERRYQNRELVQAVEQLRRRPQGDEWFIPVRLDDCDIPAYPIGGGRTLASLEPTDLFDERRDEQAARLVQTVLGSLRRQEARSRSRPLGWLRSGAALAVTASVALAVGAGVLLPHLLSPGSPGSVGSSIAPSSVGTLARSLSPGSTSPAPALRAPSTFVSDPELHRMFPPRSAVSIAPASALPPSVQAFSGTSDNFQRPDAIAADGTHVWVANADGNSVTELNQADGSLVQNLRDASYGFNNPHAIAVAGGHVWVTDQGGGDDGSVTELNEDGSLVKVLPGPSYGFISPGAVAAQGTHVWVADPGGDHGSVKELNADNGTLMRTLSAPSYGFADPAAIAVEGADVWVANYANSTVTELDATDDSVVRVLFTSNYRFDHPAAIAADGTHVWVVNSFGDSVTELNTDNGTLAQVVSSGTYEFYDPDAIAEDSAHVWVTSSYGDFVTELNADNGDLVKIWPSDVYGFENPQSVAADGTHVWVGSQKTDASAGADANWVTRFPVS